MLGTGLHAGLTANAFRPFVEDLRMGTPALGVVAPDAVQRTTLHKERCPYARPVVDGIALDVEEEEAHLRVAKMLHSLCGQ